MSVRLSLSEMGNTGGKKGWEGSGDGVKSLWDIQVENYRQLEIWTFNSKEKTGLEDTNLGISILLTVVKAMRINDITCKKEIKVILENILIFVC